MRAAKVRATSSRSRPGVLEAVLGRLQELGLAGIQKNKRTPRRRRFDPSRREEAGSELPISTRRARSTGRPASSPQGLGGESSPHPGEPAFRGEAQVRRSPSSGGGGGGGLEPPNVESPQPRDNRRAE